MSKASPCYLLQLLQINLSTINEYFFSVDPPTGSQLSGCVLGSGEVLVGDVITVMSDSKPAVSQFQWSVDDSEFSTSENISLGQDMAGKSVAVVCTVFNVMVGNIRGNDSVKCIYDVLGSLPTTKIGATVNSTEAIDASEFLHVYSVFAGTYYV